MAGSVHLSGKHGDGVAGGGGGWVQGAQEQGGIWGQAGVGNQPARLAAGAVKRPTFSKQKYHQDHKSNKLVVGWSLQGRLNPGRRGSPCPVPLWMLPRHCLCNSFPLPILSSTCKPQFSLLCS